MLLLAALVATASWSYGFAQVYPVQSPISITKSQRSARMICEIKISEAMFEGLSIHWYQQKEGRAPERILYVSEGKPVVETGFTANRYMVEKVSSQKRFILTIKDVIPDDAATYYCAYWDTHHDRNSKIITAKSPQQLNHRCHKIRGLWLLKESPSKVPPKAVLLCIYKVRFHSFMARFTLLLASWLKHAKEDKGKIKLKGLIRDQRHKRVIRSKDIAKHHGKEGNALVVTILCLHHSCHSFVVAEYDVAAQELSEERDISCSQCKGSAEQEILLSTVRPWDADIKVFGSGTKLIVSSKGHSPPANSEILKKEHENQITYVCLVEKFYPEVIRVTWTDENNEEVTDSVVKGDTWKATENEEYSIGSWLTVPVKNKDKKYYCKYEHESQDRSLPTREKDIDYSTRTGTQEEDCNTSGNSTVFYRDHIIHRTAYLVYIVLLLKSSMYYLIVLFLIYRMWAVTKHQGKKA